MVLIVAGCSDDRVESDRWRFGSSLDAAPDDSLDAGLPGSCPADSGWGLRGTLYLDDGTVRNLAISRRGKFVAFAYKGSGTIYVSQPGGGSVRAVSTALQKVQGLDFSGDSSLLAASGTSQSDKKGMVALSVPGLNVIDKEFPVSNWAQGGVAVSIDNRHVAWGRGSGEVFVYEMNNWNRTERINGKDWRSYRQDYSQSYFAHSNDAGVHLYEYPSYNRIDRFEESTDDVLALSERDDWLAYRNSDSPEELVVRTVPNGSVATRRSTGGGEVKSVDFTERRSGYVAYAASSTVTIRDTGSWDEVQTIDALGAAVEAIDFAAADGELAVGTAGGRLHAFCFGGPP